MKLNLILIFLLVLGGDLHAQTKKKSKWKKHYDLVNSDIRSVEKLRTNDLSLQVRLFELYGEKLNLLIDKENDLRILYIEKGNKTQLNKILRTQKKTLKRLENMADRIESRTKKKKILTKINYYRALNYYQTKNYKRFYSYIKKAERYNNDKKYEVLIATKLADYHFNEKQYPQAAKYYRKLIKDKKNKWVTKFYYNLAWSEVKMQNFNASLDYLRKAHVFDRKKGYYRIGEQLSDAILLFYAYSKRTGEGLSYIKKHNIDSFKNLLKYAHYVYENGDRNNVDLVFNKLEKRRLNDEQKFQLLSKRIVAYRGTKKFTKLQGYFARFKKSLRRKKIKNVKKETHTELINGIKSYTGYLQELVKSKRLISAKIKKKYIRYVAYNFSVLKTVDKKNKLQYAYYEGETYFSLKDFKRASFVYSMGIKQHKKEKGSRNNPFLAKSFDSLFKSLEKMKKPSARTILFSYEAYLHFFPKNSKSILVYQRLLNYHESKSSTKVLLQTLKRYNKAFPSQLASQQKTYKRLMNKYIDRRNVNALEALKNLAAKKFLNFGLKEVEKISKIIVQIYFSKYEDMAKAGKYEEAIDGFEKLFQDDKSKYSLRVDSLRKKMFYQNKIADYYGLNDSLTRSNKFFNKRMKKKHQEEILFYTQNICIADNHELCLKTLKTFYKSKSIQLTQGLKTVYLKLLAISGERLGKIYKMAKSEEEKNYIFKILLLLDSNFTHKLYAKYYLQPKSKAVIDGAVNKRVTNIFYKKLDFSRAIDFVNKISIKSLKNKHLRILKENRKLLTMFNFKLPAAPKVENMTPELFTKFGQDVVQSFENNKNITDTIVGKSDPNYLPYILSRLVKSYEKVIEEFKKFIPVSNNADLEKAMTVEVMNFHKFLDKQLIEYRSLYYQSVEKTIKGTGVKLYAQDLMTTPMKYGLKSVKVWQE